MAARWGHSLRLLVRRACQTGKEILAMVTFTFTIDTPLMRMYKSLVDQKTKLIQLKPPGVVGENVEQKVFPVSELHIARNRFSGGPCFL